MTRPCDPVKKQITGDVKLLNKQTTNPALYCFVNSSLLSQWRSQEVNGVKFHPCICMVLCGSIFYPKTVKHCNL